MNELLNGKMVVYVSGLRSGKEGDARLRRELEFDREKRDVVWSGNPLKQYLDVAFGEKVAWRVSVSEENVPFTNEDSYNEVKYNEVIVFLCAGG